MRIPVQIAISGDLFGAAGGRNGSVPPERPDGTVIASFTSAKAYASIQVSAPELADGTVVSLYSGEEKLGEITVEREA